MDAGTRCFRSRGERTALTDALCGHFPLACVGSAAAWFWDQHQHQIGAICKCGILCGDKGVSCGWNPWPGASLGLPSDCGSTGSQAGAGGFGNVHPDHMCVSGQHELFQVVTCVSTTANLSIHDSLSHSSESCDFSPLICTGNSEHLGCEYYLLTCRPLG